MIFAPFLAVKAKLNPCELVIANLTLSPIFMGTLANDALSFIMVRNAKGI